MFRLNHRRVFALVAGLWITCLSFGAGASTSFVRNDFGSAYSFQYSGNDDTIVYQLTATLSVKTVPLGDAKNNASISLYNGSVLIYTATATQASPFLKYNSEIILGSLTIETGMEFTLQIPSSIQSGSITMHATYSDINIPPTTINALVASWQL